MALIEAEDGDSPSHVRYSLREESPFFAIDEESGALTTKVVLDREETERYRVRRFFLHLFGKEVLFRFIG